MSTTTEPNLHSFSSPSPGIDSIEKRFSLIDYSFFTILLAISSCIGIYQGCVGNKQSTIADYLHGGKTMKFLPVAISQIASHLSGITLLGIPAEIYTHGTEYWSCVFTSAPFMVLFILYISLPVFYKLQLTSCYEYLKLRFDERVRTLTSVLFVIGGILHLPIVIYIPALAFNQVTGVSMYVITPIVCLVCIFYTTIGGLRAVVWTDALQFSITLLTLIVIFIVGTIKVGGFERIWSLAEESGRIEFFNMDLDPTIRTTFWTIAVGNSLVWININGVSPSSIQKFMAVPKYSHAVKIVIVFGIGTFITKSLSCFSGLMMYAKYHDCDPFSSKKISRSDQLLPFFLLDVAGHIPGIAGLFVAGVFSTAMSTMASGLNTLSGTIYKNFIAPLWTRDISEKSASNIMKLIVLITGGICLSLVFIVDKLGGALQVSMSMHGVTAGAHLGVFILGTLFPSANATGAFWGSIVSLILTTVITVGSQVNIYQGKLKIQPKPLSVEGCDSSMNLTTLINTTVSHANHSEADEVFWLFRISFYHCTLIGVLLVIIVGLIVSALTKGEKKETVDPDLICPYIHKFLSRERFSSTAKYASVEKALELTSCQEKLKSVEQTNAKRNHT